MSRIVLIFKYLWYSIVYYFICHFNKTISKLKIASTDETIDRIFKDKCSIGRFGDGEFYIILDKPHASLFQENSTELANRLKGILSTPLNNFLICIPISIKSTTGLKMYAKLFWKSFVVKNKLCLSTLLRENIQYYNAQITRFYIDYRSPSESEKTVTKLKRIWESQDILIVEGAFSKLGINNDLFDNCSSIERIICPPENAFSAYDKILSAAKKYGEGKLILIALGMTATVLSYDLCTYGFWALDVGHIDIEYMWMKMRAKKKCQLPGKYVNEVIYDKSLLRNDIPDSLYTSQIVCRIS